MTNTSLLDVLPPSPPAEYNPQIDFYKLDSRKLSLGEWLRLGSAPIALVCWASKLVGISLFESLRVPRVRDWRSLEVAELPESAQARLPAEMARWSDLGFGSAVYFKLVNRFGGSEIAGATLVHSSGSAVVRITWSSPLAGHKSKSELSVFLLSGLTDGRFLGTADKRAKFTQPPQCLSVVKKSAPPEVLWQAHQQELERLGGSAVWVPMRSRAARELVCDAYEEGSFQFQFQRGLYVQPSAEEHAGDQRVAEVESEARADGSAFPEARAELQRLQAKKSGSWNALLILLVTLAVTAGVGTAQWSLEKCALIIGILFIHESGHYLAMRWFNYRDVRMFFIPFFGAAVSGKNRNVAGWKKAIVSLMGPVPGVFLGIGVGAYAAYSDNPALANAATLTIILNAINMVPILPLDGGWFWNAVLFCRNRWLEAGFKVLAGLAGIGAAFGGLGKIFAYLGIVMLISVPATLRIGAVTAALRRRNFEAPAAGDDSLPAQTAEEIFSELSSRGSGKIPVKTLAAEALQVFEKLNARPPNLLESLGLSAIYGVTVIAAVVATALLVFFTHERKSPEIADWMPKKTVHVPVLDSSFSGEPVVVHAAQGDAELRTRVLAATFQAQPEALRAFEQLRAGEQPFNELLLWGQSVLMAGPGKKSPQLNAAAAAARESGAQVLDSSEAGGWMAVDLSFELPSAEAAAELRGDLALWFKLPSTMRSAQAWQSADGAQRDAWRRRAVTHFRLLEAQVQAIRSPEFQRQERQAQWRDLLTRAKWSASNRRKLSEARALAEKAAFQKLAAAGDPALDPLLIAHALTKPVFDPKEAQKTRDWNLERARLVSMRAESSAIPEQGIISGEAGGEGLQVLITGLSAADLLRDLPEFTAQLVSRGARAFHYGIYRSTTDYEDSDD